MFNSRWFRLIYLFAGSCLLFSCGSSYHVVKSNRAEYSINKNIGTDSIVILKYMPYKLRLDSQMNAVIGYAAIALTKKSEGGGVTAGEFLC